MRTPIDKIEIQEPPMNELKKGASCMRRSCGMSCGCLVIILAAILFLLHSTSMPREKELKQIPSSFPTAIPVYDPDSIDRIALATEGRSHQFLTQLARLPRSLGRTIVNRFSLDRRSSPALRWFAGIVKEPKSEARDRLTIEWKNLSALPDFIWEFYRTELRKGGYEIEITADGQSKKQLRFANDRIEGSLFLDDEPPIPGTEYLRMTLLLPPTREK